MVLKYKENPILLATAFRKPILGVAAFIEPTFWYRIIIDLYSCLGTTRLSSSQGCVHHGYGAGSLGRGGKPIFLAVAI